MKTWFQWLWENHIQKVAGYAMAGIGALEYLDQQTIQLIGASLGPKWGPVVSRGIQVAAGLTVAIRAHQSRKPS
jgi:hypothetical protein